MSQRLLYLLLGILIVLEPAREVLIIGAEVEVTMPAQGNKDGLFLPCFPALEGFIDCHPNMGL
jgi:hypothetical protein